MYHSIQFALAITVDLETSPKQWQERVAIRQGTQMRAQIKPYVVESKHGPIEVADLFFEDGTTARMVPFAHFSFVE